MQIDEAIAKLEQIRAQRGSDVDMAGWEYAGGVDALYDVEPVFDEEAQAVVMKPTKRHSSMATR